MPLDISERFTRVFGGQYMSSNHSSQQPYHSPETLTTPPPTSHPSLSISVCHLIKPAYIIPRATSPLYNPTLPRPPLSLLKSLAFWLRSSVVSVLHSLIAVTGLRTVNNDYSYFWNQLQNLWACSRSALHLVCWQWSPTNNVFHSNVLSLTCWRRER